MRKLILFGLVGGITAVVFRALTGSDELLTAVVGGSSGAVGVLIIMIIHALICQNHHNKSIF